MSKTKSKRYNKYEERHIKKELSIPQNPSDQCCSIWIFDNVDKDGEFNFDPNRTDFDCKNFLNKLLSFSNMTWSKIKRQTHDDGKSKHHLLAKQSLSKKVIDRIIKKGLEDQADYIFSFSLSNVIRVIGVRDPYSPKFQVMWYDPEHKFAPSKR